MRINTQRVLDFDPQSTIRNPQLRRGFTIVELLVAMALIMLIMAIIGMAFGSMTSAMRQLKAIGDMQEKLRAAAIIMQRDMAKGHFGGKFQPGLSGEYLSDQRLDLPGWSPPDEGYFEIRQAGVGTWEGQDNDGVWSTRSDGTTSHTMRFTSRSSGKREEDWNYAYLDNGNPWPGIAAAASVGNPDFNRRSGNQITGIALQWAEIGYFLSPIQKTANGQQLYALYRKQRAIMPATAAIAASPPAPPAASNVSSHLSVVGGGQPAAGGTYNSPATVTDPVNRMVLAPSAPGSFDYGDDILVTDVISFQIKVAWKAGPATFAVANQPLEPRSPFPGNPVNQQRYVPYPQGLRANLDWPFDVLRDPGWGMRFDTMSRTLPAANATNWDDPSTQQPSLVPPISPGGFNRADNNLPRNRIRVMAIMVTIRVWDFNTQQSRQMTFIQDM
jgi:type II secretory pathway pseudopilin PulG